MPFWVASLFVPGWTQLILSRTRADVLRAALWCVAIAAAYVLGGCIAGAIAHAACVAHGRQLAFNRHG